MQLTSHGGMLLRCRKRIEQALVAVGVCLTIMSGMGCLRSLRPPVELPMATVVERSSRAEPVRFSDTVTIAVDALQHAAAYAPAMHSTSSGLSLDSAVRACEKSDNLPAATAALLEAAEKYSEDDSLHWEALYLLGDCYALAKEYDRAVRLLGEVAYRSNGVPPDVHQRAIVRLGHVYCVLGDVRRASAQFDRLRQLYRHSPYLAIADCGVIR